MGGTRANVVSAAEELWQRTRPERRPLLLFAGAVMSVVALGAAIGTVDRTGLVLGGLALVVILSVILSRLEVAVAVLAATFYFNAYVNHGVGILTIDKGIGLLAVAAWLLDWTVNRRQVLGTRQLWLIGAFLLWSALSMVVAVNEKAAFVEWLRYVTFGTLFFLVIQTVRGDRRRADALVRLVVVAAAVASVIGLVAVLVSWIGSNSAMVTLLVLAADGAGVPASLCRHRRTCWRRSECARRSACRAVRLPSGPR